MELADIEKLYLLLHARLQLLQALAEPAAHMSGAAPTAEQTVGLNISRDHPTRNATYDWRIFVPPRSPMAASQFGHLEGLRNIRARRAIEFPPRPSQTYK